MKTIYLTFALLVGAGVSGMISAQDKMSILKSDTSVVLSAALEDEIGTDEAISNLLKHIPDNILFGLETSQKIQLTSHTDNTTKLEVDNIFGGNIERTAFSPDFIALKTSDAGTIQIKLLPLVNDTKMVCVVKTVRSKANVSNSTINFYTTQWKPIAKDDLMSTPTISLFTKESTDLSSLPWKNASSLMDTHPMKITLFPDNTDLSIRFEIDNYLPKEEYKNVEGYLTHQERILHWDKKSYK